VATGLSSPALAQEKAGSRMQEYLCALAGKCADEPAEEVPTIPAPDTKVFDMRPKAAKAAPATAPAVRSPAVPRVVAAAASARAPAPSTRGAARVAVAKASPAARRMVRPEEARVDLRLSFELNSATLTAAAREDAKEFAKALLLPELATKRFRIEGHTDSRGSRPLNIDLSERRARAVVEYLGSLGIPAERLEVRGFGPDRPLKGRSAAADENRRVEAVLIS
jgi:outer membrane protein OmpA-like peptidoglycan-associated protein